MRKKAIFALILFSVFLVHNSFAKAQIVINEFVVDPQTDWNSNSVISDTDEWFELFNKGASEVNLTNWQLLLVDSSNATQILSGVISPGEHLVILNPVGTQNNDGQLILKDDVGTIVDQVTYGNYDDGNVVNNAPNGNANSISNECVARFPDGSDTGVDLVDFIKITCTFGTENLLIAPENVSANGTLQIISTPSGASITDNGIAKGVTPSTYSTSSGNHTIELSLAGYFPQIFNVEVQPGQTTTINATLIQNITIIPITISSSTISPSCLVEGKTTTISAFVNGSVQSVTLALNTNGTWHNISLPGNSPGTYQRVLSANDLANSGTIFWQFIVKDLANNFNFGAIESAQVHTKTTLNINPSIPDGLNSWYLTEPSFTFSNPDATKIFYKWDSQSTILYSGAFGVEDAPNNANISGGILDLNFWSDVCAAQNHQNESIQTKIIKIDFTNPVITNLVPADNSLIFSQNVLISALIDEIYQSNSGINLSSINFFLDGSQVSPNITQIGIDASVSYFAHNLDMGNHDVLITASDKSGRFSQKAWSFVVSGLQTFSLILNSPSDIIYETRRVPVNLSMSRKALEIQYMNHNDGDRGFRRLCRDCTEYGESKKKLITMVEGLNNLTFRALGSLGELDEENVQFIVDTKLPKITKTSPKKGFASGIFEVEIIEKNPVSLILFIEGETQTKNYTLNLSNCLQSAGGKMNCEIEVDLSEFDSQQINYWFALKDILGDSTQSKKIKLSVDTTPPVATSFSYNILSNGRVFFQIEIEDANFNKIVYIDQNEIRPRERTLCTRLNEESLCKKTISFTRGNHNLDIFAFDKAGNGVQVADDVQFLL